jgi:Flp pilus assembly protein TadD
MPVREVGFPASTAETRRPAPVLPAEPSPRAAPASVALLAQSRDQRAAGSYAAAASSIERALRIEPSNAELWLELGEIKLADDDPQQAEQMVRKALTLAGSDGVVAARAERLLALAASCARGGC